MKKTVAMILAVLLAVSCMAALATGGELTLREGRYIVGEEIPAGTYTLTCVKTSGEEMGDAYGALGSLYDSLGGTDGYGALFGALGGMMEEYVGMTVEVLGGYGDVLKSFELKAGESMLIALKANTALKITDGACALTPVG